MRQAPTVTFGSKARGDLSVWEFARRSSSISARATLAILLVFSIGVSLVFWPGDRNWDAISQIIEARTGQFTDWWAPVLDAMWRVLFLVHLSPGVVLLASTTIFILSIFELLRTVLSRQVGILATLLIVAFPPVLGWLGALQRDTWFGASTLASYALLARVHRGATRRPRLMAGLALLAVWFAMAARQNAVLALLPATAMAVHILVPVRRLVARYAPTLRARRLTGAFLAAAGAFGVTVVFAGSQWLIEYPVVGTARAYPQVATYYMDLGNISLRTGQVLIPSFSFPAQSLSVLGDHNPRYSWLSLAIAKNAPLQRSPQAGPVRTIIYQAGPIESPVTPSQYSTLQHDWLSAIVHHPEDYLIERWGAWLHLIGWNTPAVTPYNPGMYGRPLLQPADHAATSYLKYFSSAPYIARPLYDVWLYMIVGIVVTIDLLRRSRPARLRVVGAMSGFALIYGFGYFFLMNGDAFRSMWYTVTAIVIATVVDLIAHGRAFVSARVRLGGQNSTHFDLVQPDPAATSAQLCT